MYTIQSQAVFFLFFSTYSYAIVNSQTVFNFALKLRLGVNVNVVTAVSLTDLSDGCVLLSAPYSLVRFVHGKSSKIGQPMRVHLLVQKLCEFFFFT